MEFPQVKRADADALVHFLTAEEWPFHAKPKLDPDDVRARLASGAYDDAFWMVDGTTEIGLVRLFDLDEGTPLFDLRLSSEARGRGAGTAAVRWLTEHVFTNHDTNRIEGTTRRTTTPCGASSPSAATSRRPTTATPGRRSDRLHDSVGYAILRRDWETGTTTPVNWADGSEELVEQRGALVGQHPADHLGPVGEPPVPHHVPQRPHRAGLGLPRAENHPRHPRQHQRAGTHRARLDRHDQRAPGQPPPVAEPAAAARNARISACAVGSPSASRALHASASTVPSGADHERPDRHVVTRTCGSPQRGPTGRSHCAMLSRLSSSLPNSAANPHRCAIDLQLLVRVEFHLARDHPQLGRRQADVGEDVERALRPHLVIVIVVGRRVHPQHVQRVRRDVVVQRRRRVRQEQLHAARPRPQHEKELVIDVEQPENRARRPHLA